MIAYFDCSSGISGDMILGALIDAGVPPQRLRKELSCLALKGYKLNIKNVKRGGFKATKLDVHSSKFMVHSSQRWKDIKGIIEGSPLPEHIKQRGLSIFKRLFEVEAKVHGKKFYNVHLHELAAIDCIVDVFGTLISLDILGIDTVYSSPLNLGSGTIKTEHRTLPVPAPATAELLQNIPVYSSDVPFELTTPTGAVLISSLATGFGPMPKMYISKIGVGAGSKDFKEQPNILRVFIGENAGHITHDTEYTQDDTGQCVTVIETNIDDMNPQIYEYVMERLFKSGAFDVFLTQVIMKKGRPGIKLTVLCSEDKREKLIKIILKETTSIGVRFYRAYRKILQREIKSQNTRFGKLNVKVSRLGKEICKVTPEYEECKKIAKKYNIPLLDVIKTIK
jgi:hypothetical protein